MYDKLSAVTPPARSVTPPARPGALLRDKRLEYGWSVDDVAGALCLSRATMDALEDDAYHKLPGETYILGYWKTYAGLLDISIDASIEAHKPQLSAPTSDIAPEFGHQQQHGSAEQARHRVALLFGLLSVIFIGSLWYWQSPDDAFFPQWHGWRDAQSQTQTPAAAVASASPTVASKDAWSGDINHNDAPDSVARHESLIALPEPNFSETDDADIGDAPSATGAQTDPEDEASAQPQTPLASPNEIILAVERKSWIDIRDDAGERLIYRTVDRGQRLTLEGKPPFSVFIGNAKGVAVEYRGKPVPVTSNVRGLFARFNIGTQ